MSVQKHVQRRHNRRLIPEQQDFSTQLVPTTTAYNRWVFYPSFLGATLFYSSILSSNPVVITSCCCGSTSSIFTDRNAVTAHAG
mmetsp:Transcript_3426/g.13036  ORF Transcript_3426/g.13036 Transcript_3426/m.13036 type:complete len:84 (-) Transcript_3426:1365-1616(-)